VSNSSEHYYTNVERFSTRGFYERDYFAAGDDAHSTGYGEYADGPWSARLALIAREFFAPRRVVEVGCARGYVVRHLREAGVDALGFDYSSFALATAPHEVQPFLGRADATALPVAGAACDTLLCFETFEHLYPHDIPAAAREIARCTTSWAFLSIPTYGIDDSGRAGIPIDDPDHQADAGAGRAFRKLVLDAQGNPDLGHLTLATWQWWTAQFAAAGMHRIRWLEQILNAHPFAADSASTWFFYIFAPRPTVRDDWRLGAEADMSSTARWQLGDGWHAIEGAAPRAFRWTDARAMLTLRADGQRAIQISAAGGPRDAEVDVWAGNTLIGQLQVRAGWQPHSLTLLLREELRGETMIELRTRAPLAPQPGGDARQLGVMVWHARLLTSNG
jgi:SAM-dependent methyltransferase